MINDPSINVYEVVAEAESYFQNIDKNAKGSGWKAYNRWLYENEPKFYPSGDRSNVDPFFVSKEYLKNNILQEKSLFDNGWEELGPHYIEQVTGHYAVGLGRVESFYADPNDSNRIYLGSRSGGFWKTIDGGNTWINTTDFLYAAGVNTIAVSPENSNNIIIRCYLRHSLFKKVNISKSKIFDIMKNLQNTLIRGIKNIISTSQEKMITSYIDKDGSIKQKDIYFILTSGSNLEDVLILDFIDETRTQTSSIIETNNLYGIDISRDKIVYELSSTMGISKISGTPRHRRGIRLYHRTLEW